MPPRCPTLKLTRTTTATAYTFHPDPDNPDNKVHGIGWAICTVNDATGELAIQSDWGNWQYQWSPNPKHLGSASLTHFIGERGTGDYIADKLTSRKQRENFDGDKTIAAMRKRLAERRLEEGRAGERRRKSYEGTKEEPLTAEIAREIWDALGDIDSDNSGELFIERFLRIPGSSWVSEEPWDVLENTIDFSYTILLTSIIPALIEACFATAFPGRHRCQLRMSREDGAGHWRDWHRGHSCHLDDTPIASPAEPDRAELGENRCPPGLLCVHEVKCVGAAQ